MANLQSLLVFSLLVILCHSVLGTVTDPCDQNPCQNGATCNSNTNSTGTNSTYQCLCPNGFSGANCEQDPCNNSPCLNDGTCVVRPGTATGYICRCRKNFNGKNCEKDSYACRSSPCQNGATCKNRPATGSYICRCLPGSSGDQCEINVDECASNPCQNNATCTDLVGGYICNCPKGMVGKQCEMDFSSQIEVLCEASEMIITLAPSLLVDGDSPSSIHLNSETCMASAQGSSIILSTSYGDCGTTVEESGETIIFTNTILYTKEVVTTHKYLQLPVQCIMGKTATVGGASYGITRANATAIQGYGQFDLTLERYYNESFTDLPSEEPVRLRDELFYAVSLDSPLNLTVLIDACWATPSPDAEDALRYDLITDGCPADSSLNIFTNLGSLKQGFSFEAFAFIGGYPQVHVHCSVTVCLNGCTQGCSGILTRRRRDASALMSNAISSEPITLNYDV